MGDDRLPNADYYRRIAKQIRELAERAQFPEVRTELLELAERFRRMAVYVERRYPNGRETPSPPDGR
jgi:HAMP domain-containing protein